MFQNILAGTDGSDTATLAVHHAVDLAERLGAEVTVLTVHRDETSDQDRATAPPDAGIAGALLRDVESTFGTRVRLRTRSAEGNPAEILLEVAETDRHDLVVVGNRGISGEALLQPSSVSRGTILPDGELSRSGRCSLLSRSLSGNPC